MTLDGIQLMRKMAVWKDPTQYLRGIREWAIGENLVSTICLCLLLARPFCLGVQGHEIRCKILLLARKVQK